MIAATPVESSSGGVEPGAEHEFEAEHGLPEPLPAGERLLWQGAPVFAALAERVFHARTLALYFAAILVVRGVTVWAQEGSAAAGAIAALWLLPAAGCAVGLVVLLAWLTARTTVYTITDKRVVMRVGIVLTVTFNLPFTRIDAAAVRPFTGATGDIALAIPGPERIAYLHLWPHVRPWRVKASEPMLRCIDEVADVARLLSEAWSEARKIPVAARSAPRPAAMPSPASGPVGSRGFSAAAGG